MTDPLPVEILERKEVYRGFFRIDLYRLRHGLFGGGMSPEMTREVFERGHAVAVLLFDPDRDAVVLIEQFRLPARLAGFSAWQIEVVAGMTEAGETAEEVARRETLEETGIALGELIPVRRFLSSPGGTTETVTLFCGRVDSTTAGGVHGDSNEDIRVLVRPFDEAAALMESGVIANGYAVIALQWLAANRSVLRRRWLGEDDAGDGVLARP